MNSNRIDLKYLNTLHEKEKKLEEKLRERER